MSASVILARDFIGDTELRPLAVLGLPAGLASLFKLLREFGDSIRLVQGAIALVAHLSSIQMVWHGL